MCLSRENFRYSSTSERSTCTLRKCDHFQAGTDYTAAVTNQADGTAVADAILINALDAEPSTFTWHLDVPESDTFEVFVRWTAAPDRATDATLVLTHDGGSETITVNQQMGGATWNSLGTYTISTGSGATLTLNNNANGKVIADAVRLEPIP